MDSLKAGRNRRPLIDALPPALDTRISDGDSEHGVVERGRLFDHSLSRKLAADSFAACLAERPRAFWVGE
jgi:hypothetical protein